MKIVTAAEQGFGRANSFYLLMWVVISIVGLTTYFEHRKISSEEARAEAVIAQYEELLPLTDDVKRELINLMVSQKDFETPFASMRAIRSGFVQSQRALIATRKAFSQRRDVEVDDRIAVNALLERMIALHYFNDPTAGNLDGPFTFQEGRPSLRLVEHNVGTLRIAEQVSELFIEDAARLLWLASMPLGQIEALGPTLLRQADHGGDTGALIENLTALEQQVDAVRFRAAAEKLWNTWFRGIPGVSNIPEQVLERRARQELRLGAPGSLTLEAYSKLKLAAAQRAGTQTQIELPIVSVPLRLIDALIFLPWVLLFCLVAILIYTTRGLRYSGQFEALNYEGKDRDIIGGAPVYFDPYGVFDKSGWAIASLMLAGPVAIAAGLPFIAPFLRFELGLRTVAYCAGLVLCGVVLVKLIQQSKQVFEKKDQNVIAVE